VLIVALLPLTVTDAVVLVAIAALPLAAATPNPPTAASTLPPPTGPTVAEVEWTPSVNTPYSATPDDATPAAPTPTVMEPIDATDTVQLLMVTLVFVAFKAPETARP